MKLRTKVAQNLQNFQNLLNLEDRAKKSKLSIYKAQDQIISISINKAESYDEDCLSFVENCLIFQKNLSAKFLIIFCVNSKFSDSRRYVTKISDSQRYV